MRRWSRLVGLFILLLLVHVTRTLAATDDPSQEEEKEGIRRPSRSTRSRSRRRRSRSRSYRTSVAVDHTAPISITTKLFAAVSSTAPFAFRSSSSILKLVRGGVFRNFLIGLEDDPVGGRAGKSLAASVAQSEEATRTPHVPTGSGPHRNRRTGTPTVSTHDDTTILAHPERAVFSVFSGSSSVSSASSAPFVRCCYRTHGHRSRCRSSKTASTM